MTRWRARSPTGSPSRLDHRDLPAALIRQTFDEAIAPRSVDRRGLPRRHHGGRRPRSRLPQDDGAAALFQRLPGAPGLSAVPLAPEGGAARFRAEPAEPRLGGVRRRHQSGRAHRQGHIPRPRDRSRGRRDDRDRRQRLDPAGRDARRHRQGDRRPSSQDPPRRADRRGGEDPRQYRDRLLRAGRGGLGRARSRCRTTRRWPACPRASSAKPAAPSPRAT